MSSDDTTQDTALNAIMIMQRHVFAKQVEILNNMINTSRTPYKIPAEIPELLIRRRLPEEFIHQNRLVDNEELAIMDLLDSKGQISSLASLEVFMVLLTRITKVCVHHSILYYCLI